VILRVRKPNLFRVRFVKAREPSLTVFMTLTMDGLGILGAQAVVGIITLAITRLASLVREQV
jgi:hypothetical protein